MIQTYIPIMAFIVCFFLFLFQNYSCYKIEDKNGVRNNCYLDYFIDSNSGYFQKYIYKDGNVISILSSNSTKYFDEFKDSFVSYEIYKNNSYYRSVYYKIDSNKILCKSIQNTSLLYRIYIIKENLIDSIYEINNNDTLSNVYFYNLDKTISKIKSKTWIKEFNYYEIKDLYYSTFNYELYKYFKLSINLKLIKSIITKDLNGNVINNQEYSYKIDSTNKLLQKVDISNNIVKKYDYFYHCD